MIEEAKRRKLELEERLEKVKREKSEKDKEYHQLFYELGQSGDNKNDISRNNMDED